MKLCMWNTKQNKSKRLLRKKNIEKKKRKKKATKKLNKIIFLLKKKHEITKIDKKKSFVLGIALFLDRKIRFSHFFPSGRRRI